MNYFNRLKRDKLFVKLCEDYQEKILKYIYYATGDFEEAKDLTQEVFTVVYKKMDIIEAHENRGGYIFVTAKNIVANFKRKKCKKLMMEENIVVDFPGRFKDIQDELEVNYDHEIDETTYVEEVMGTISDNKQELYRLHYIEGKSYKEIAKLLGVNETSLRMRYVRLRREIQQVVGEVAKEKF